MRIAYFDPYSGASGDMILGALLDAGLTLEDLRRELAKLHLTGFDLRAERAAQHGLAGTRVIVDVAADQPARNWATIRSLISDSSLDDGPKAAAQAVFARLAEAEAKVHGTTPEEVHFHEVGGVDAIVDVCGACIGLDRLGVERVFSAPPRLGSGFARSQHGLIPVPGPATAELLARAKTPTLGPIPGHESVQAELLTPTGAAILTALASFTRPDFAPSSVGYGFGTKELPWPNALRLWIGETTESETPSDNGEIVIETNIDDMNPQAYELLTERLFAAGALDVWLTPIVMKKGRPATQLSALCPAGKRQAVQAALIENSTTLGVRTTAIDRTKADRRIETVTTRWGDIRVKLRGWDGRVIDVAPEYDDCVRIARTADIPFREIWNEAHRIAEVYVGRKLDPAGNLA
ncbi:MAG: pyridinium-3,5-bisthiocarboxylic acid mononucleotide nickel chelatase [Thermomicrobiales bacterium]|nr:pyridinium-3,5-bisthiocarboxylic acid mononucleotide nickel chelatase [Thermomicrobiales bacterium]